MHQLLYIRPTAVLNYLSLLHLWAFEIFCFLYRSQVGFGFVFTVSDSDSQFRIRKSNTKLENLKAILLCFKEN